MEKKLSERDKMYMETISNLIKGQEELEKRVTKLEELSNMKG